MLDDLNRIEYSDIYVNNIGHKFNRALIKLLENSKEGPGFLKELVKPIGTREKSSFLDYGLLYLDGFTIIIVNRSSGRVQGMLNSLLTNLSMEIFSYVFFLSLFILFLIIFVSSNQEFGLHLV
jgi:hypothetical protein